VLTCDEIAGLRELVVEESAKKHGVNVSGGRPPRLTAR
jgi:hypothetical protein